MQHSLRASAAPAAILAGLLIAGPMTDQAAQAKPIRDLLNFEQRDLLCALKAVKGGGRTTQDGTPVRETESCDVAFEAFAGALMAHIGVPPSLIASIPLATFGQDLARPAYRHCAKGLATPVRLDPAALTKALSEDPDRTYRAMQCYKLSKAVIALADLDYTNTKPIKRNKKIQDVNTRLGFPADSVDMAKEKIALHDGVVRTLSQLQFSLERGAENRINGFEFKSGTGGGTAPAPVSPRTVLANQASATVPSKADRSALDRVEDWTSSILVRNSASELAKRRPEAKGADVSYSRDEENNTDSFNLKLAAGVDGLSLFDLKTDAASRLVLYNEYERKEIGGAANDVHYVSPGLAWTCTLGEDSEGKTKCLSAPEVDTQARFDISGRPFGVFDLEQDARQAGLEIDVEPKQPLTAWLGLGAYPSDSRLVGFRVRGKAVLSSLYTFVPGTNSDLSDDTGILGAGAEAGFGIRSGDAFPVPDLRLEFDYRYLEYFFGDQDNTRRFTGRLTLPLNDRVSIVGEYIDGNDPVTFQSERTWNFKASIKQ